jgi:hypothetical protein
MNVSKSIMQNFNRAALALVFCLLTLTSAFALTNENHNLSLNNNVKKSFKPSAVFNSCWIDYNVNEGGAKGMRIHVNFEVTGLKGIDSKLVARVQTEEGDYLTNDSASYSNDGGELETSFAMNPGYPTTVFKDADMFLPYSEINIAKGVWTLKLDIDLSYENGDLIQHLTYKEFEFTQTVGRTTPVKTTVGATVKRVWVDYNVTEDGRKGMRLHVNFEVTGLKGVDTKIVARVQKESGDFLTSASSYSNGNGQLETSFDMKPGYATAVYEDADMFLPYDEINVRKGVWNLKFDIDLSYENGDLIQHLQFYPFEFTR